jgi:hypothetical protein
MVIKTDKETEDVIEAEARIGTETRIGTEARVEYGFPGPT